MNDEPTDIVERGYDRVSHAYRDASFDFEGSGYQRFLGWLLEVIPNGRKILDLGCGCGIPVAKELAREHRVVGVDISQVQIDRARALLPQAELICGDMAELRFPASEFDAVVAFYSIIHLPVERHPELLSNLATWIRPGGWLLASVGHEAWTGTEENWCDVPGATMYWSHADVATYRVWLEQRGLEVVREGFLPEGDGGHSVLLARRGGGADG